MNDRDESYNIPKWNGDPPGFKRWQQEVKIFKLRKDLTKEVSYAAELIVGLSGPARTAALQLSEDELWPLDRMRAEARDEAELAEPDEEGNHPNPRNVSTKEANIMSIDGLVRRLERDLLQSKPIQRGERMEAFFGSQKYNRKRGMRMTEYNLLWQKGIEELKEVDIDLGKLEDVAGWFYLRNSGLSHEQKERVLATYSSR